MASTLRDADIPLLMQETIQITQRVQREFGALTDAQLNWKPSAAEWSIGQCIDHLIITNTAYFSTFQQVIDGTKKSTFWERLPLLPAFFGALMIKTLDPDNPQRVQAPKVFRPLSSTVRMEIVSSFVTQQEQLVALMQASQPLAVAQIIITSPAAVWMTYSFLDAYRILVVHEQRHLLQMRQVLKLPAFPAAGV